MMSYSVPGFADEVSRAVLQAWNDRIKATFTSFAQLIDPSFMKDDPLTIPNGKSTTAVKWPGSPAEPEFCLGDEWAERLSNWGVIGRHELHNEYLEFGLVMRPDDEGRLRPKRFVATTELREYWLTLAVVDPDALRRAAHEVLGRVPEWREFYGPGVDDPARLSADVRQKLFIKFVAGNGNDGPGPGQPEGSLNRENVLFMSHPINGLDDLIYVVAFGAHPYVVREAGGFRRATLHEIFINGRTEHLACRNADPAACGGAFTQVYNPASNPPSGRQVAFTDPIGMYIRGFRSADLRFNNAPIPDGWIRLLRGQPDFKQRIEFGPADDKPGFLDEVKIEKGEDFSPLVPGYELAKRIEVGPHLTIGEEQVIPPAKFLEILGSERQLNCSQAEVCERMKKLKKAYESQFTPGVRGRL